MSQRLSAFAVLSGLLLAPSFLLFAEGVPGTPNPSGRPWKSVTELSIVSANGNTRSQSTAGKETLTYDWSKTTLELIGSGYGAKDKGETIAEKYLASEKLSYKLSDRNYTFEKFEWSKDRFSGIDNRYDSNVGLGRQLLKTSLDLLFGEVGVGYIKEERIGSEDDGFSTARAYSKYIRTLSPTSNFSQDAEYTQNLEDSEDFRMKTETGLTAAISKQLALKVTYTWRHVQKPPDGFGRNDTIFAVALVGTY